MAHPSGGSPAMFETSPRTTSSSGSKTPSSASRNTDRNWLARCSTAAIARTSGPYAFDLRPVDSHSARRCAPPSISAARAHSACPASVMILLLSVSCPAIIRSIRSASTPSSARTMAVIGFRMLRGTVACPGFQPAAGTIRSSSGIASRREKRSARTGFRAANRGRRGSKTACET
jgi:hypothetical protein